eukprot:CAMPEP_0170145472 /NCGR_PEP_ID=MMETSP0033_2-20121228/21679_1 /TAXON_ID=195969 /ORGANISM="Dolichomastix tenuilepis, Strain CCMP3274" /LENGTH=44 /DNA_ID= /DNA_START= /DNA_END= /DNA_ORIENTATION=
MSGMPVEGEGRCVSEPRAHSMLFPSPPRALTAGHAALSAGHPAA